jgi:hypothetical protein
MEMAEPQTHLKMADLIQAMCLSARGEANYADLIDRIRASTRHPEPVVDLDRVRRGRRNAAQPIALVQALSGQS